MDKKEFTFEDLFSKFLLFYYVLYISLGILGVLFYLFHLNKLLVFETVFLVILFILRYGFHLLNSFFGMIWVVLGICIGYFFFHNICLGINISIIIRHIVKDVFFDLLFKGSNFLGKL